MYIQFKK